MERSRPGPLIKEAAVIPGDVDPYFHLVCPGQGQVADQLVSRRKDHGQVSIIMSVLLDVSPTIQCSGYYSLLQSRNRPHFDLFLDAALKTVAYLRVSTRSQDLANQKLAILEFSQKRRFPIDQFIESRISSRQSPLERRIDEMLGPLQPGDRLLVSELSRLGRGDRPPARGTRALPARDAEGISPSSLLICLWRHPPRSTRRLGCRRRRGGLPS